MDKRNPNNICLIPRCKDCYNIKSRERYVMNREKVLKRTREYSLAHPEIGLKARRKFQRSEKGKLYSRNYIRKYRKNHPEKFKEYDRKRNQEEPRRQQMRLKTYRRRKTLRGSFTQEGFLQKLAFYGNKCLYCRMELDSKSITRDHKIPLIKGGLNFLSNIAPCCRSCNSSKCDKSIYEFINHPFTPLVP